MAMSRANAGILQMLPPEMIEACAEFMDIRTFICFLSTCKHDKEVLRKHCYSERAKRHALELEMYHVDNWQWAHRGPLPCSGCRNSNNGYNTRSPGSRLSIVIYCHEYNRFKSFVDAGIDLNMFIDDYWNARLLLTVLNHGTHDMAKLLLERGADMKTFPLSHKRHVLELSDHPWQILDEIHEYHGSGVNIENLQLLLEKGATFSTMRNFPSICKADSSVKLLELALKNGVDIHRIYRPKWQDKDPYSLCSGEMTVLHYAAATGTPDLLDFILRKAPEQLKYIEDVLEMAFRFDRPENALYILHKGGQPTPDQLQFAFGKAFESEHWHEIIQLIGPRLDLGAPEAVPCVQRCLDHLQGLGQYGLIVDLLKLIKPAARLLYVDSLDIEAYDKDLECARKFIKEFTEEPERTGYNDTEVFSWQMKRAKEITEIFELMREAGAP
ncbi:hypothetical protein BO78DRAFT_438209 [Aspergillus sclerotiicarbonarius CBS 121057]|uniref:Ankyrin n=1 Tax=Aspergillus sclerotiicarbonarius (strain CBS 121057 / IBT 28362) TaxID=1448318 RepID=A0A319EXN0_ASPSB|nr:hypothetical protein BO78DRAFT_438209 [Aspergillus sclerotiicarbonarius CBS 121057]